MCNDRGSGKQRERNWHHATFPPRRGILGNIKYKARKTDWPPGPEGVEYQAKYFQLNLVSRERPLKMFFLNHVNGLR